MIRTPRDVDFELPLSKRKDFPVTLRVTHSEFKMKDLENYVLLENAGNFLQIRGQRRDLNLHFADILQKRIWILRACFVIPD